MSRIVPGKLVVGSALMASFIAVLIAIFLPLFDGQNALNYLDNLYNSISKASAYYIPKLLQEVEAQAGRAVKLRLAFDDELQADRAAVLLEHAGGGVTRGAGDTLEVSGTIDGLLKSCLNDADDLYHNRGAAISGRYQMDERRALHTWSKTLGEMEKDLGRQREFSLGKLVGAINAKAVECAYNYYRIEPQAIGQRWGIVLFSLAFYVIYTIWYGYAVMFLFEGFGFRLEH
jgi:hypothetical protein